MKKIILILGFAAMATNIAAQYNTVGLYNPHFTFDKAAFIPSKLGDNDSRFEMRILPNASFYVGNDLMSLDDILYPTTAKLNKVVENAADVNTIATGLEVPWLSFSYKIAPKDKELLTVGLTSKMRGHSNISLGGNFLRLLWDGNKQFAGQTVDLGATQANAYAATEIGLSLAAPFKIGNTSIRAGGAFKYLMAYGGISLPKTTSTFTTESEGRYINLDVDYKINMAISNSESLVVGRGVAFDLGATVKVGEDMSASIAILDIGGITYSKNTKSYQFSGEMNFEGIELDNLFVENSLEPDTAFINQFKVNEDSNQTFSIALPTRMVLQFEKHLGETTRNGKTYTKHGIYATYIQGFNNMAGGTTTPYASLGYSYSFRNILNAGPTINYGSYSGLGAGMFLSAKAGPFRIGVGSNTILSYLVFPKAARGLDASFTTAFAFGKRKEKTPKEPKAKKPKKVKKPKEPKAPKKAKQPEAKKEKKAKEAKRLEDPEKTDEPQGSEVPKEEK